MDSGAILVDGRDVRDVTQDSLHRAVGIVQQDVFLFASTVGDNIRYGRPDATDAEVMEAAKRAEIFDDINAPVENTPRIISTGPSWAYLRIAEGCNNYCAFCAIPYIRGRYRSRNMEEILEEARALANQGVKELIVIAQDITRYGIDLYGAPSLAQLCHRLSEIEGIQWIRLHYLYPEVIDDNLIEEIATNPKIMHYLDIPIQHINDGILKKMNRHTNGKQIRELFQKLRKRIPDIVLRTSIITGLPGEGDEEFEELCGFLKEVRLERVGVFPFSPEEGTPAGTMEHVDEETAERRADLIMDFQSRIMEEHARTFIGKTLDILIEGIDPDTGDYVGRSYMDSPDIDGIVYVRGVTVPGNIVPVKITEEENGNLFGSVL